MNDSTDRAKLTSSFALSKTLAVAITLAAALSCGDPPSDSTAQSTGALSVTHDRATELPLDCDSEGLHPKDLACTGLYSDWPLRTVAAGNVAYDPGLHLWSDGAAKSRWVYLPPGTQIDTANMNEWVFPVGTKFWKEFRLDGKRVETRYLYKEKTGWFATTYPWSDDEASATQLTTGATHVRGATYEIPSRLECIACHMGRVDFILGFEAIGLSSSGASGLTMSELGARKLITIPPVEKLTIPGDETEAAALGWLHANCGTACHNAGPSALAGGTGMFLRLNAEQLGSVKSTDAYQTAVGHPSRFQPAPSAHLLRIAPGDPERSAVVYRDERRDTHGERVQMPPFDTHVPDVDGTALVRAWIAAMPRR